MLFSICQYNLLFRFLVVVNFSSLLPDEEKKFLCSQFFVVPQKVCDGLCDGLHKTFGGTAKKCENKNLSQFLFE